MHIGIQGPHSGSLQKSPSKWDPSGFQVFTQDSEVVLDFDGVSVYHAEIHLQLLFSNMGFRLKGLGPGFAGMWRQASVFEHQGIVECIALGNMFPWLDGRWLAVGNQTTQTFLGLGTPNESVPPWSTTYLHLQNWHSRAIVVGGLAKSALR